MCGIVGYIGKELASHILLDGLKRLEYRGYDSSGIATIYNGEIQIQRAVGKLLQLEKIINAKQFPGTVGIGHTRWATHGKPTEENAHPHIDCTKKIVVVHNGIIENNAQLRALLINEGHQFISQTDTEILPHLIEKYYSGDLLQAVLKTLKQISGAYAIGIIHADEPGHIIAARNDCPLIIGKGNNEQYLASDVPALLHRTRDVMYLDNGEIADISCDKVTVYTLNGMPVQKKSVHIMWDTVQAEKEGFRHFMLKEIHEQPDAIRDTLRGRLQFDANSVIFDDFEISDEVLQKIHRIIIVACGTSYHAGMVGKFLFEELAHIPCEVDIASEFRYRDMPLNNKTLFLTISQSGETADTLAALREAKRRGCDTIAICNVLGSSLAREAHNVLFTHCGPEIGVASTKAFTGQLTALYLLALYIGLKNQSAKLPDAELFMKELSGIASHITHILSNGSSIEHLAKKFYKKNNFLYLGRHLNFPIALEGALKLKEISYIHAEGYPAGEMKHGPIALMDEYMPVLAIATKSRVYDKVVSNIEEAKARGGIIIAVATEGDERIKDVADYCILVPDVHELLYPLLTIIPLQLFAYHIAVLRGCDVDQPRNLAKSVTVE